MYKPYLCDKVIKTEIFLNVSSNLVDIMLLVKRWMDTLMWCLLMFMFGSFDIAFLAFWISVVQGLCYFGHIFIYFFIVLFFRIVACMSVISIALKVHSSFTSLTIFSHLFNLCKCWLLLLNLSVSAKFGKKYFRCWKTFVRYVGDRG